LPTTRKSTGDSANGSAPIANFEDALVKEMVARHMGAVLFQIKMQLRMIDEVAYWSGSISTTSPHPFDLSKAPIFLELMTILVS